MSVILYWFISRIHDSSGWLSNLSPASVKACTNSSECDRSSDQICLQLYDGCPKGQCMCEHPSRLHPPDDINAKCVPMRLGLESCSSESMCRDGMSCKNGTCRCLNGKMTSDRLQCLPHNARLLQENCSPKENSCYQKAASGYTSGDVTCSANGVCACAEGHKTNGLSCRRRKVYEYGCRRSYHCEGGAVCSDSRCVCPVGYNVPRNPGTGFKCIRNGATTNVGVGGECDEINERLYCATDLVCHKCASERIYHCVRFLLANDFSSFGASAGTSSIVRTLSSSFCSLCISVILSTTLRLIINRMFTSRWRDEFQK